MVHSNGTRFESQRLRMERTGRRKYSGRSADCRRESAAGEFAARRAMPTSGAGSSAPQDAADSWVQPSSWRGAPGSAGYAGGQSGVGQPGALPLEPAEIGARSESVRAFEPRAWVKAGNNGACRAESRWGRNLRGGLEETGDMAHLTARRVFRLLFAMSSTISLSFCPCAVVFRGTSEPFDSGFPRVSSLS